MLKKDGIGTDGLTLASQWILVVRYRKQRCNHDYSGTTALAKFYKRL
jgi:hypothetical protein